MQNILKSRIAEKRLLANSRGAFLLSMKAKKAALSDSPNLKDTITDYFKS